MGNEKNQDIIDAIVAEENHRLAAANSQHFQQRLIDTRYELHFALQRIEELEELLAREDAKSESHS